MADNGINITALTGDHTAALDRNQLELSFTGGSMDFTHDPGFDGGAAQSMHTIGGLDVLDLNGNIDWGTINSTISLDSLRTNMQVHQDGRLQLIGDNADIEINGESVVGVLREIRDRLGIIRVSEVMEAEWSELRELRQQYEAKLAECEEKSRIWGALQQMPSPQSR